MKTWYPKMTSTGKYRVVKQSDTVTLTYLGGEHSRKYLFRTYDAALRCALDWNALDIRIEQQIAEIKMS